MSTSLSSLNATAPVALACTAAEGIGPWLAAAGGSLDLITCQTCKVVLVGWDGRRITVMPRNFDKPMGLAVDGPRLALATRYDVTLLPACHCWPLLPPGGARPVLGLRDPVD
jgi:hypothetical protein